MVKERYIHQSIYIVLLHRDHNASNENADSLRPYRYNTETIAIRLSTTSKRVKEKVLRSAEWSNLMLSCTVKRMECFTPFIIYQKIIFTLSFSKQRTPLYQNIYILKKTSGHLNFKFN